MRHPSLALFVAVLMVFAGLPGGDPPALAESGSDLVISQVYGGGGNSGATYTHDFIELFNRGSEAIDLTGWSVQYASAAGTTWANRTNLSGVVQPGQYYLIQQAAGAGGTQPLPTPDATGTINMSATSGKVALVSSTTALSGSCPTEVVDFVGYGTANCFEGDGTAPGLSNTTAALRLEGGCQDTDHNAADFTAGAPTPRNTAADRNHCDGDPGPEPDPDPDPEPVCGEPPAVTKIGVVQGPGDVSPCVGETVTIVGIVVGDYEGPAPNLRGFYVQSADDDHDDDPLTSEGIFVFNGNDDSVDLGDLVEVTGTVAEFQGQTQLGNFATVTVISSGHSVTPATIELPFINPDYLERYEGMLVNFPQDLIVTEFFQLGRFGQVVVSSGDRLRQPTHVAEPGAKANAVQAENDLNRLIVDDALNNQNPDPIIFGRGGQPLTAENTLRGGDTLTGATGVLTYTWSGNAASGNAYRLRPVSPQHTFEFQAANLRPLASPVVGGSVRVGSFNVLNYFLTLNQPGTTCGVVPVPCRGADSEFEFQRQRVKLLSALVKLDAHVVGLMELENTPGVSPEADIVSGLNDLLGDGRYAYVDAGVVGGDVIRVGIIYQPGVVTPLGDPAEIDFADGLNRTSLAQTFVENTTGEVFSVVVNHFKSKGCAGATGADLDQGDGQSCWNPARVRAAEILVEAISELGHGDDDWLIIGDLNSYSQEDPISVLREAGFVDVAFEFGGEDAYSFVFDGQWGYLDYALASASLLSQVTGAAEYHINADEPSVLDYNTNFKSAAQVEYLFAPDEFRTSDHDPVLVGLSLSSGLGRVAATPDSLWPPNQKYVEVEVTTTSGLVEIVGAESSEADDGLDPEDLPNDVVIVDATTLWLRAERWSTDGRTYTITAEVRGDGQLRISEAAVVVPHSPAPPRR